MDHARAFWSQTLAKSSIYRNNDYISSRPGLDKQKVNQITPKWIIMTGCGEAASGRLSV